MIKTILHFTIIALALFQCGPKPNTPKGQLPEGEVSITYIAHACFLISDGTTTIMLDPYADRVWLGYDFQRDISVDAVFITHPHYDHDGGIFRGKRPYWMFETPFYQNPAEYEIGDFKVKGIIGKHADPYGKEFGQMNTIWKVEINGIVFAHWGDNGPLSTQNFEDLKDVNVLLIPMDGDYHIITSEAYAETFQVLEPKMIIPMHYRIPELEENGDSPSNLGEIEPFLAQRPPINIDSTSSYLPNVVNLETHVLHISEQKLPQKSTYYVFTHSPKLKQARP